MQNESEGEANLTWSEPERIVERRKQAVDQFVAGDDGRRRHQVLGRRVFQRRQESESRNFSEGAAANEHNECLLDSVSGSCARSVVVVVVVTSTLKVERKMLDFFETRTREQIQDVFDGPPTGVKAILELFN